MAGNSELVDVMEEFCNACGTPRVTVHHQGFPELRINGESPSQAANELLARLKSNLTTVSDSMHRAPVQIAISDVQAFIDRDADHQPEVSTVIDVGGAVPAGAGAAPQSLVKAKTLEVRRLTLPKGRTIPAHHAAGEITVHCLDGRVALTANGQTRDIGAGQLIVLAAGEPHSLVGLEDSTVLVTKVLLTQPPKSEAGISTPSVKSQSPRREEHTGKSTLAVNHPPPHAYPGRPIDLRPEEEPLARATTVPLVKEGAFEAIRMVLRQGRELADHQVEGPITIYCLEGRIAFTARGQTHELRVGHWLYLLGNEPHSLRAMEDSSILLTILFPRSSREGQARASSDLASPIYPRLP